MTPYIAPTPILPSSLKLTNKTYDFNTSIETLDIISFNQQARQLIIVQNGVDKLIIAWPEQSPIDDLSTLCNSLDKQWFVYKDPNRIWAINLVALNSFFTDYTNKPCETQFFLRGEKKYQCLMVKSVLDGLEIAHTTFCASSKEARSVRKNPKTAIIQLNPVAVWTLTSKILPLPKEEHLPDTKTVHHAGVEMQTWKWDPKAKEIGKHKGKRNRTQLKDLTNQPTEGEGVDISQGTKLPRVGPTQPSPQGFATVMLPPVRALLQGNNALPAE